MLTSIPQSLGSGFESNDGTRFELHAKASGVAMKRQLIPLFLVLAAVIVFSIVTDAPVAQRTALHPNVYRGIFLAVAIFYVALFIPFLRVPKTIDMRGALITIPFAEMVDLRDRIGWLRFVEILPAEIRACRSIPRGRLGPARLEIQMRDGIRFQFEENVLDRAYRNGLGEGLSAWLLRVKGPGPPADDWVAV